MRAITWAYLSFACQARGTRYFVPILGLKISFHDVFWREECIYLIEHNSARAVAKQGDRAVVVLEKVS
jgi:hypothetical protein